MTALLIVDDSKVMLEGVRAILHSTGYTEDNGFKLITAEDGASALKAYEANKADIALILTDLNYPGGGGLEFIKAVRGKDAAVPIIMMTMDVKDLEGVDAAMPEFRGIPVLSKSVLVRELVPIMKKMLAGRPGAGSDLSSQPLEP